MDCNCPAPTSLTEIIAEACGVDLKQIQRLSFQRSGSQFEGETPTNAIEELASWQAFTSASDDTKIVSTPLIGGDPVIEAGDAISTGGGDNSTFNGVEEIEGTNPSSFSCVFKSLSSTVEKQLKALMCEKNLVVFLHLQGGRTAAKETSTALNYVGFNVYSLFVSDRSNAGYGTKDTVTLSFQLQEGWSDDLKIVTPNFNPLTEL